MTNDPRLPPNIMQVQLEKIRVMSRQVIPLRQFRNLLARAELLQVMDHESESLVLCLTSYVLGMPEKRIEIDEKWPATWWDAFKERWFPAWALQRWPVRYRRIYVNETIFKAVCPHIDAPETKACIQWFVNNQ